MNSRESAAGTCRDERASVYPPLSPTSSNFSNFHANQCALRDRSHRVVRIFHLAPHLRLPHLSVEFNACPSFRRVQSSGSSVFLTRSGRFQILRIQNVRGINFLLYRSAADSRRILSRSRETKTKPLEDGTRNQNRISLFAVRTNT